MDVLEFDAAAQRGAVHEALIGRALDRQMHQPLYRCQCSARLMVAGQQRRDLAHRSQCTTGEYGAGNETTRGELAVGDHIDAEYDDDEIGDLLRECREVDRGCRKKS